MRKFVNRRQGPVFTAAISSRVTDSSAFVASGRAEGGHEAESAVAGHSDTDGRGG